MTTKLSLKEMEEIEKDYKVGEVEYNNKNGLIYLNFTINGTNKWRPVQLTWWDNFLGRSLDDKVEIELKKLKAHVEEKKQERIQHKISRIQAAENQEQRANALRAYANQKNAEIKQKQELGYQPVNLSPLIKESDDKGSELFKNNGPKLRSGSVNIKSAPTSPRPPAPAPQPRRQQDSSFQVARPKKPGYYNRNEDIYDDNDRSAGLFTRDDYNTPCRDSDSSRGGGYEPSSPGGGGSESCGGGGSDD